MWEALLEMIRSNGIWEELERRGYRVWLEDGFFQDHKSLMIMKLGQWVQVLGIESNGKSIFLYRQRFDIDHPDFPDSLFQALLEL